MKRRHNDVNIFLFVYKTCEKELTVLKPCRLIVHLKFYKICKFVNHVTRNDVIMTSLLKTMKHNGKVWKSSEPNKVYIVRNVLRRAFENVIFIAFEPLCQKL